MKNLSWLCTAEAFHWFHIWVGVYHDYHFQIIPGNLYYGRTLGFL